LEYLRQSPLISSLGIGGRFDAASALQRILLDTIEGLRPTVDDTRYTEKRTIFDILNFRYIQQFKQNEVAHHVGLSERHFRREQDQAVEILHSVLCRKFVPQAAAPESPEAAALKARSQDEWEWLKEAHSAQTTNLPGFVENTLQMMQPVAARHAARLNFEPDSALPDLAVHPVALRQMLLNLLQVAINAAGGGQVQISASAGPSFTHLRFISAAAEGAAGGNTVQEENLLKIAAHLADLSGGQMAARWTASGFEGELSLPVVDGIAVVVVDDNLDSLELLARYTSGTRYRVSGTSRPEELIDLAISLNAQIVVLDVMMPRMDGWELLGRLRSHPSTADIPVIIHSILSQEELALSLGARRLVLKPVTQGDFLTALDEVLASKYSDSR
jgi:CheY-like chemotaxis protein